MYRFFCDCVGWNLEDVHKQGGLCDLISERREITRRTFLRHVDREELAEKADSLGYARHPSQGLTMAADWHIEYFRSRHHGEIVYGFQHSAIEHVFRKDVRCA